jgi:hypothetical protein
MATGTRANIGNLIYDGVMALSITPPTTITTAVVTSQTLTVQGIQVNDFLSWNIIATGNNLVSIANMYASAPNTIVIGWSTEGATISNLVAQQVLIGVSRPENGSLGFAALPANMA